MSLDAAIVECSSDKPGYLPGYGVLPAATVTELAKHATLRPVAIPKDLVAEANYRPSTALTRFIRCRDLTCRWPGCDQRAQFSDIDHTVPYPYGPTHPSNNKPYCRIQHRMNPQWTVVTGRIFSSVTEQGEIRMFDCEAVDLDFLNTAPARLDVAVHVGRPPSEVFAALAHNPATWGEFYPGFDRTGRYLTPVPHGVGSRRTARFIGAKFEETILAWDEGARWAFRVDSTQAPLFDACIEDYQFDADGSDATLLRWTLAYKPRLAFKLARPLLPRFLAFALTRAAHNLEHGRWFSTPTTDS